MRIQFYNKEGNLIKVWHNVNPEYHFIPQKGDNVLLHFGDYNEEEKEYSVLERTISGTNMDLLRITLEDSEK